MGQGSVEDVNILDWFEEHKKLRMKEAKSQLRISVTYYFWVNHMYELSIAHLKPKSFLLPIIRDMFMTHEFSCVYFQPIDLRAFIYRNGFTAVSIWSICVYYQTYKFQFK